LETNTLKLESQPLKVNEILVFDTLAELNWSIYCTCPNCQQFISPSVIML